MVVTGREEKEEGRGGRRREEEEEEEKKGKKEIPHSSIHPHQYRRRAETY